MSNDQNLKPFLKGNDPRRGRKPKGAIHLSTRIQNMLNDDNFTVDTVTDDGKKKVEFKGNPAHAIITTAIIKAINGDSKWADWLAKHGYGEKLKLELDNPIAEIVDKYGKGGIDELPTTQERPPENNA